MSAPVWLNEHDPTATVQLVWDHVVNDADIRAKPYDIFWDQGRGGKPTKLFRSTSRPEATFTIPEQYLRRARKFQFAIRARNECGACPVSDCVVVSIPEPPKCPAQMDCPQTRLDGCNVVFNWNPPRADGGSEVTDYVLKVRGSNRRWYEVDCTGARQDTDTSCRVPMKDFEGSSWRLRRGETIQASVQARNSVGLSDASSSRCCRLQMTGNFCKRPTLVEASSSM